MLLPLFIEMIRNKEASKHVRRKEDWVPGGWYD